jgi:hypothetical protein
MLVHYPSRTTLLRIASSEVQETPTTRRHPTNYTSPSPTLSFTKSCYESLEIKNAAQCTYASSKTTNQSAGTALQLREHSNETPTSTLEQGNLSQKRKAVWCQMTGMGRRGKLKFRSENNSIQGWNSKLSKYQATGKRKFCQIMLQGEINFDASKYQQLLPSPPTTYTMNDFYKKIV